MNSKTSTAAPAIALVVAALATWWWIPYKSDPVYPTAVKSLVIRHPSELESLPIDGAFGGESIAFDSDGDGPYVGVSNGRILKWDHTARRWQDFAFTSADRSCNEGYSRLHDHEEAEHTCGRPLGLRFHITTGNLYIADAYMGLLVVGPNGGLATKLWAQDEETTSFTNYLAAFITGDTTGRFMKYDLKNKQVSILIEKLKFPNGVSLSKDGKSVLIIESVTCKVLRYWLEGTPKNETLETIIELSGFPDNIKRNSNGEYWIGVYSKKTRISEFVFARPWVGNFIANRPKAMRIAQAIVRMKAIGMGFKLSEEGEIKEAFEDRSGVLKFVSEVEDKEGDLFFGSVIMPFIGVYKDKSKF
ncbi:hypothetical protein V2J09_016016 [Rumex salicifolius]